MTPPTTMTLTPDELMHLDGDLFAPDVHHRIDIQMSGALLPVLVVRKERADTVVIMNNGAVDQHLANRSVVFQRSTWSREIQHHQIYVYDPATGGPDFLSLAWGQMSEHYWVVPDAVDVLQELSTALGCPLSRQRRYFGSSAGAFMALAMMAHDPGSRAVINNAQFDWTKWMPPAVNELRKNRFRNMLPTKLREKYPSRTNALELIKARKAPLRVDYHVNLASKHDRLIDYPMFHQFMMDSPWLLGEARVNCYFEENSGHNPLPKHATLAIINDASRDA